MCWSGEASAVLAATGLGITAYLIKRGERKELWLFLFYFTLMEALQAVTYIYIDQCTLSINKALTFIGYTHIAFQPVFINMAAMCFIPVAIKNKISKYVYGICALGAGLFMLKAYPIGQLCSVGTEGFCGPFACSYKGSWHVAWQWPLNNLGSHPLLDVQAKEYVTGQEARQYMFRGNWEYIWEWLRNALGTKPLLELKAHKYMLGLHAQTYLFCAFILPIAYGSWRVILVMFLLGPFIASFFTSNINEFPAVWCLFSIGLCSTIVLSPIRQYLYVKDWLPYAYFSKSK